MLDYRNLTIEEMCSFVKEKGEKEFRGKQIFKWIHKGTEDISDISDVSSAFKEELKKCGYICNMGVEAKYESKTDGTIKYLMRLMDGNIIECVFMKYSYGNSICISTQAGCNMGCSFCASAIGGKNRDLTAGEMLGQVLKVQKDSGEKISNIVLMGTGEPLDNFENVIKFLNIVNHPQGINIGMRHITISTCGLVPQILRLADMQLQITLAISLHAPNDALRRKTMPVAYKYSINELMEACNYYIVKTNRRITFEYALINGLNDSQKDAQELSELLKGMLCHVNLIPINEIKEREYKKSNSLNVEKFKKLLEQNGIETTVRRELGSDINAACGQLRRLYSEGRV